MQGQGNGMQERHCYAGRNVVLGFRPAPPPLQLPPLRLIGHNSFPDLVVRQLGEFLGSMRLRHLLRSLL